MNPSENEMRAAKLMNEATPCSAACAERTEMPTTDVELSRTSLVCCGIKSFATPWAV